MLSFVQTLRNPLVKAQTGPLPLLTSESFKSKEGSCTPRSELVPVAQVSRPKSSASQRLRHMRTWHVPQRSTSRRERHTARSRTWRLKQQHCQPPPLPHSEWAEKIYRRRQAPKKKTAGPRPRSSATNLPQEEVRSSLTSRNDEEEEEVKILRDSGGLPTELAKEPSVQTEEEETEEEPRIRSSRSVTRRSYQQLAEQGRTSRSSEEEEAVPHPPVPKFERRRTTYYTAADFSDSEEEESESSDESSSDFDDDNVVDSGLQDEGRVKIFYEFQVNDELMRQDLPKALESAGFMCPQEAWMTYAWNSVKAEVPQEKVDLEDFLQIVQAYEQRHHLEFATAFASCDKNGSGVVESSELADLLLGLNIEPMSHVLDEVINEVDTSGLGTLNLDEFKQIMQLLLVREGFSKSEHEEFITVFQRYDRDNSGECDANELAAILNWLGFAWSRDRMKAVLKEVDVDESGCLNLREFILCMRKVREVELKAVKTAMANADADGNGLISREEMPNLLSCLGYDPSDVDVILEAQRRAGLEEEEELELGQVWQVLTVYRRFDGFTMEECERFDEVFNEHSQGQEEIVSVEVPKALRALGFKLTFEVVQSVIGRVDVDDTGTLSISEFRKMIRMLEEREESFYRRAFQNYAKAKGSEVASYSKAQEIARSMGFHLHKHHMGLESEEAAEEAKISCEAFTRACCKVAQEMREVFRRNGGFSDEELQELQNMFHRYDSRKSGRIANKDLVRLVENVCPSLAREKSLRPTLQEMMQACQEFNGCLRFKDFLKLMRLILDFQDKERAQTEVSIIKSTGFTLSEVQEFRELFLEVDEGTGVVTFEACRSMIHRITPLGDNLTHQLKRIFEIQTRKKPSHRAHEADFPEFLMLMKQLLEMNFAQLREKTTGPS